MTRRGVPLMSAIILIVVVAILAACIFITQLWVHAQVRSSQAQMQSAAFVSDLDYWFVNLVERSTEDYGFSGFYSADRDARFLQMQTDVQSFARGTYRGSSISSYDFAAVPATFEESHLNGVPVVSADVFYVRKDVNPFLDIIGVVAGREYMLSTFNQRSYANYRRNAFLQDSQGKFVELDVNARVTG